MHSIRRAWRTLLSDLDVALARDPAATGRLEVAVLYPGVHAIWAHRAARALWDRDRRFLARALSQLARAVTGIEIHPAAAIGPRCFIDHGMGVVIGETASIGADVTIFHGVTLGAAEYRQGKRHPTVGDGVVIGAGAKILGPVTIGDRCRIGANAVVTHNTEPGTTAVGVPARARH